MSLELNNEKLRVRLVPEIGGSIVECSVNHAGQWVPIMRQGEVPLTKLSQVIVHA